MTDSQAQPDPLSRARELLQAEDAGAAEAWARQAIDQEPQQPKNWTLLAQILQKRGHLTAAAETWEQVAALDPEDVHCRSALGFLYRNMSCPEEAIHWHGQALALQPDELILKLNHLFVLPVVPTSGQQIERLRQRCFEGMEQLRASRQPWRHGPYMMSHHPYYLIYHNRNDRELLEHYGEWITRHAKSLAGSAWEGRHIQRQAAGRKRRIGFLSGHFSYHSNSLAFEGLIRHLDRSRFEVAIIHLADSRKDATRDRIDALADCTMVLQPALEQALPQIDSLELDLLYFTDIGMHPISTLLACRRSAPVQVTGWGVPQTSGLKTLDHYMSAKLVEPPDAQAHYSEHLALLPGLPSCYLRENLPIHKHTREYFILPTDEILLGCLQTFWKLHPDFDVILEQIAQQLPSAWFVFVEASTSSHTAIFMERLQHTAPTMCERLILLTRQDHPEFISLAASMDLLLDPPYFGSGVTLYDTIHAGTPIVCMEGEFLRSRYVAAAYRLMGLEQPPIAANPDAYVAMVVQLATDTERLARLRREIGERAQACLYNRLDGVEAFADFAWDALEQAQRGSSFARPD